MNALAVSVPQAAELLSISRAHAYRMVKRGELPVVQLGGRTVVSVAELERLLEQATPISAPLEDSLPGADRSSSAGPHRDTAVGRVGTDDEIAPRSAAAG